MNSKNKSQPSVFVSDWWTKEEENEFRLDIGMTNDKGKLCWGVWGSSSNSSITNLYHIHSSTCMHLSVRRRFLLYFSFFRAPGGLGLGGRRTGRAFVPTF